MQGVQLGPRQLAFADFLHGRRIPVAPAVGKAGPVDGEALGLAPSRAFRDDRTAPIDHRSESIEDQRLNAVRLGAPASVEHQLPRNRRKRCGELVCDSSSLSGVCFSIPRFRPDFPAIRQGDLAPVDSWEASLARKP